MRDSASVEGPVSVGWLRDYCRMLAPVGFGGGAPSEAYVEVSPWRLGKGRETLFAAHVDFGRGDMAVTAGGASFYRAESRGARFAFVATEIQALWPDGSAYRVKSRRFGPSAPGGWRSREELVLSAEAEGRDPEVVPCF